VVICYQGEAIEFVEQDDASRKWLNDFRGKSYAKPIKFEAVEGLVHFLIA